MEKILIANRGEIALRIARACRELGIASVAVYSTADADSAVVRFADEAVQIGPPAVARSYLNIPSIIEAAVKTGADAIHPGYGFLSEDPYFAEICANHNITFIGPTPGVMERMGDKAVARQLMPGPGCRCCPAPSSRSTTADEAQHIADSIGYPVIIKAVAGGGGRGMTVVWRRGRPPQQLPDDPRHRAGGVQGQRRLHRELPGRPRHTEIQIVCDSHGNGIHLGERDCSVQRRHQKLIEEAPSVHLTPELRAEMGTVALQRRAVPRLHRGGHDGIPPGRRGPVLVHGNEHPDPGRASGHRVITGIDLIKEQIRVARGERLSHTQDEVQFTGHAIECRINAEDPDRDFAPSAGRLDEFAPPGGPWTRVDSHCFGGWTVSPYYDSLLAKLIVWAPDRAEAIERMDRALAEFRVNGPGMKTTIGFHQRVFAHPVFRSGDFHTDFVDRYMTQK